MECLRRLLRRSSEALFLLQLISHHHVTRLIQCLDSTVHQKLIQLTFNQLVCSEEGDHLAMQLIAGLMEVNMIKVMTSRCYVHSILLCLLPSTYCCEFSLLVVCFKDFDTGPYWAYQLVPVEGTGTW